MTRTVQRLPVAQLAVLATVLFAAVLTEVMPVGLLPLLTEAFDVSEKRIGWWMSAYALIVAFGAVPLTAVLARRPKRTALLILLAIYAASNALILVAPSYWVGLAGRVIGGVAHAGIFSIAVACAASLVPAEKAGRAVAIVNAGVGPALAFGLPAATAAGTAWGWRWPFAAATVVMVGLAVATARIIPADPAPPVAVHIGDADARHTEARRDHAVLVQRPAADAPSPAAGVLAALRGRGLQTIGLLSIVMAVGHYTAYTYITPLLLRSGVEPGAVSLVLLGYGVASTLGLLLAGALVDRRPTLILRLAILMIAASLVAVAALTRSSPGTTVAVLVWGAAFGAVPTLLNTAALRSSAIPDVGPAVVNATFNIGIASGAWVGGWTLQSGAAPTAIVAATLVAVSLLLTAIRR